MILRNFAMAVSLVASVFLPYAEADEGNSSNVSWAHIQEIDNPIILWDSIIHQDAIPSDIIVQCFNDNDLPALLEEGQAKVVVHHGAPVDAEGYVGVYSHTETLPFFVNERSGVTTLNDTKASALLSGEVSNWSQIGGENLPVRLYGPDTALKRKALSRLVNAAHGQPMNLEFQGTGDYDFLASTLNTVPGALVVGLRSSLAQTKYLTNAIRTIPRISNLENTLFYAMPIFVYMKRHDVDASIAVQNLLKRVQEEALQDGFEYPLEERLKQFQIGAN